MNWLIEYWSASHFKNAIMNWLPIWILSLLVISKIDIELIFFKLVDHFCIYYLIYKSNYSLIFIGSTYYYWRTDTLMMSLTFFLFYVGCLFSNRSQKTSKVGKNSAITSLATFLLFVHFWCHLWSITEQMHGNMESICKLMVISFNFCGVERTLSFHKVVL